MSDQIFKLQSVKFQRLGLHAALATKRGATIKSRSMHFLARLAYQ